MTFTKRCPEVPKQGIARVCHDFKTILISINFSKYCTERIIRIIYSDSRDTKTARVRNDE